MNGMTIPKGTQVIHVVCYLWVDPELFNPDRFLSVDGTKIVKPDYFIPVDTYAQFFFKLVDQNNLWEKNQLASNKVISNKKFEFRGGSGSKETRQRTADCANSATTLRVGSKENTELRHLNL